MLVLVWRKWIYAMLLNYCFEKTLLFKDPSDDGNTESHLIIENEYRCKDYYFHSYSLKKSANILTKKSG